MSTRVAPPRKPRDGSVDPRMLARRAGVLRAQARRRGRNALFVLAILAVVAGGWFLLHSRLFSARVVTVVGSVHTPVATVVRAAGLESAPPLLDVGAQATAGVERLPWVQSAQVTREWPDGVRVDVHERVPVAVVAGGASPSDLFLVDRSARVVAAVKKPPSGLVEISGGPAPGPPGSVIARDRGALEVVASLPKAFSHQVKGVRAQAGGDVSVLLGSAITVELGPPTDLAAKYEDVAAILSGAQLVQGDVIDVSAPGAPVVQAPGTPASNASGGTHAPAS